MCIYRTSGTVRSLAMSVTRRGLHMYCELILGEAMMRHWNIVKGLDKQIKEKTVKYTI